MSWRTLAACALMAVPPAAQGQAFNIDLDVPDLGPLLGSGVPPETFGAAAAQPGVWTRFSGPVTGLVDISGTPTGVHAILSGDWSSSRAAVESTNSLEYGLLMNDGDQIGTVVAGGVAYIDFTGLANGPYRVYVYAADTGVNRRSWVSVPGSFTPDPQLVTGPARNSCFTFGITHSVHSVNVTDGHLRVIIVGQPGAAAEFAGMQIVPEPGALVPLAVLVTFGHRRRPGGRG